jgi:hypothetical protein
VKLKTFVNTEDAMMNCSLGRVTIGMIMLTLMTLGCGGNSIAPSQLRPPMISGPVPGPSAPQELVRRTWFCVGDAGPYDCSQVIPDADGGYTLNTSSFYSFLALLNPSAAGRCSAWKVSFIWGQPGSFGECAPVGPNSGADVLFITPGANAALDLQRQGVTLIVEERGPDLPEPRTQTIDIPVRLGMAPVPPNITIFSQGTLDIPQSYTADLDGGVLANDATADIWFHAVTRTARFLTPIQGAILAKAGLVAPGRNGCATHSLSAEPIDIAELGTGSYVCVKTNGSRFSQVRIAAAPGPDTGAGSTVTIEFVTFGQ